MKVKICGMRDSDNALVAARAGADYLGFVFVEGVRRQLLSPQARAIIERFRHEWAHDQAQPDRAPEQTQEQQLSNAPQVVGLFRNQPADWVKNVVEQCGLDIAQLCGDEDDVYARSLGMPVLRQIRVRSDETQESLRARVEAALHRGEMVHLDRDDPKVPGGGGVAFDWRAAEGVASMPNVLLSGGLNPENVAVAIARLRPWGVDVSSGVETAGQKDPVKIGAFISSARSALTRP